MILEMRRALEDLKSGNQQGYKRMFDATYEEVYSRCLLIVQREEQAAGLVEDFYATLFDKLKNAEHEEAFEGWFWQLYYQMLRKHYHKLLASQEKGTVLPGANLSKIPASFPLLHRIMLVMYYQDDFTVEGISGIFGLSEEKIHSELEKLEKALPNLVKDQPEDTIPYVGNFKVLLLGASSEVLRSFIDSGIDGAYEKAAKAAGIAVQPAKEAPKDDFEYFVADVDVDELPKKPKKKPAPIVEEEEDEDLDEEEEEIEDDDEDEDDDDEEENDRYDWDIEDDGKKMVILGIILGLILVVVVAFAAFKFLNKDDKEDKDPVQTEDQIGDDEGAPLIIKGGEDGEDGEEPSESEGEGEPEETPEETPEEAPEESEESQAVTMTAIPNSMNVRSEPNTNSTVLTTVKAGEKLEILGDSSQEWVQIRCIEQDNQEGYVMTQYLKAE